MYAFMMDIVLHRARHKMTYPVKKTVPGNWTDGQTDRWMNGLTDGQLCPVTVAIQLHIMTIMTILQNVQIVCETIFSSNPLPTSKQTH